MNPLTKKQKRSSRKYQAQRRASFIYRDNNRRPKVEASKTLRDVVYQFGAFKAFRKLLNSFRGQQIGAR